LPSLGLLGEVARHALAREVALGVEHAAQLPALVVVGEARQRIGVELVELVRYSGRSLDRVSPGRAVEGIGRMEQRVLLGRQEAVQRAVHVRRVGRIEDRRRKRARIGLGFRRREAREVKPRHHAPPSIDCAILASTPFVNANTIAGCFTTFAISYS
jgi:hypothetical protein